MPTGIDPLLCDLLRDPRTVVRLETIHEGEVDVCLIRDGVIYDATLDELRLVSDYLKSTMS